MKSVKCMCNPHEDEREKIHVFLSIHILQVYTYCTYSGTINRTYMSCTFKVCNV